MCSDSNDRAVFLKGRGPLKAGDAVAALLVLEDDRYIMQLRDPKPEIFYPDHWGCFGGAVDGAEDPLQALKRELREELEFEVASAVEFTAFEFDLSTMGQKKVFRIYYLIPVRLSEFAKFVLHEGTALAAVSGTELLTQYRVTPYDAFALWLHMNRDRIGSA